MQCKYLLLAMLVFVAACGPIRTLDMSPSEDIQGSLVVHDSTVEIISMYRISGKWYIPSYDVCEGLAEALKTECMNSPLTPEIKERDAFLEQDEIKECLEKNKNEQWPEITCIKQAAEYKNDPDLCRFQLTPVAIANCVSGVAQYNDNIELCKTMSCDTINWLDKVECDEFALSYPKYNCFLAMGKKHGCEQIIGYDAYSECMYSTMEKDLDSCKKLKNIDKAAGNFRDFCITDVGVATKDLSVCEEIEEGKQANMKDRCIAYVAIEMSDVSTCLTLGEWWKPQCIQSIASKKEDPSICNNLDGKSKDSCISSFSR